MRPRARVQGMTLVELLLAMAMGAIVLAALASVIKVTLDAQRSGSANSDQAYSAGFALDRMVLKTRAAPTKAIAGAAANSTGNWLAPLAFCLAASASQLRETTDSDSGCAGGVVLSDNVTAFSAQIAPSARAVDAPVIVYSLTVAPPEAVQPVTLTASVRLGGGLQ